VRILATPSARSATVVSIEVIRAAGYPGADDLGVGQPRQRDLAPSTVRRLSLSPARRPG